MRLGPRPAGVAEVALRLMARRGGGGGWTTLLLRPTDDAVAAAEELAQEMEALGGVGVERIESAADALALIARLAVSERPAVVVGLDEWPASEWGHLDLLRSRLARAERTALVVSEATYERILRDAPNLESWLGASVWTYQADAALLTEEESARRLAALQAWSGLSDEEVIARAQARTLPADPEFAEWLVLLHRGDLL
jgi:hypothetical protein